MKVLVCPGSFKGTISSVRACRIISSGFSPFFETISVPLADGGDGTLEAVKYFAGGKKKKVFARDPFGKRIKTEYLSLGTGTALVELALTSGLKLTDPFKKPALYGSTFGTGEVIDKAIKDGAEKILLCAGGSATVDAGTGILAALGVKFFDLKGKKIKPCGANLKKIFDIDFSGLNPKASRTGFEILCDVQNPLFGKNGGIRSYSAQKGADHREIEDLEKGASNLREVVLKKTGKDIGKVPFGGAAGGVPAMMSVFFNSIPKKGAEFVCSLASFEEKLRESFLAVTGEGKVDATSSKGKITGFVSKKAFEAGIPALVLTGSADSSIKGGSVVCVFRQRYWGDLNFNAEKDLAEASKELAKLIAAIMKKGRGIA